MYGVEAATTGRGGLLSPATPNPGAVGGALGIRSRTSGIAGSAPESGLLIPLPTAAAVGGAPSALPPQVAPGGGAVERPVEHLGEGWMQILDFHNSPAPWILLFILVYYGWTHHSLRRRGGK